GVFLWLLDQHGNQSGNWLQGNSRDLSGRVSSLPYVERPGDGAVQVGRAGDVAGCGGGYGVQPGRAGLASGPSRDHWATLRASHAMRADLVPSGFFPVPGGFLEAAQLRHRPRTGRLCYRRFAGNGFIFRGPNPAAHVKPDQYHSIQFCYLRLDRLCIVENDTSGRPCQYAHVTPVGAESWRFAKSNG